MLKTRGLSKLTRSFPKLPLASELLEQRQKLTCSLLLFKFENNLKLTKAKYYVALGNEAGALLARQVKAQRLKYKISSLHHPTTKRLLTNPQDIANVFSDYYSSLYNLSTDTATLQPTDQCIQNFLSTIDLPHITHTQLEGLSQPFSDEEVLSAIKTLPLHKSPGEDGYTNEFYKTFDKLVTPHLTDLFNSAATSGSLPLDMRSIITTTPKPEKDPTSTTNYRPISLLNTDVKIFAMVIASRLLKCLPSLVHMDQVGFMPDRQAPDATRRVIDLIHQVTHTRTPSLLLYLDAEKAFDRVHWGFLRAVLSKFGIIGWFQTAILSLYSNPTAGC